MNKKINLKLLACLLGALAVLGIGVHFLHGFQVKRNASAFLRQADIEEKEGRLDQAENYLARYLDLAPDDIAAREHFGLILEREANAKNRVKLRLRAFYVLSEVLRRDPSRPVAQQALVRVAMNPALARYSDARIQLEALRKAAPRDPELAHQLGDCYEHANQYAVAATYYEEAIAFAPAQIKSHAALADVKRRRIGTPKSVAEADKVIDDLIAKNKDNYEAHLVSAQYWQRAGSLAKAEQSLLRARELAGDKAGVLQALALLELAKTKPDLERARRYLDDALKLDPTDGRMYQSLATLELQAGHRPQAIAGLRRALTIVPERQQADLRWILANVLLDGGDLQEAGDVIKVLEQNELPPALRQYLEARKMIARGQWQDASRLLSDVHAQLVEMPDQVRSADFLLGVCFERLGDPEKQYTAFRQVVTQTVGVPDSLCLRAYRAMASALVNQSRSDEALEIYLKLADRDVESALLAARLLLAKNQRLPAKEQSWERILQLLDGVKAVDPDAMEQFVLRADVLAEQKQMAQARQILTQARDAYPKKPEPWIGLAALAAIEGSHTEPLSLLDEAERRLGNRIELRLARVNYWGIKGGVEARKALAKQADDLKLPDAERSRLVRSLASAYLRLGDLAQADRFLAQFAEDHPSDLGIRMNLFDRALESSDGPGMRRQIDAIHRIEGEQGARWRYGEARYLIWQATNGDRSALPRARKLLSSIQGSRARVLSCEGQIDELESRELAALHSYQRAMELGLRSPLLIRRVVELLYRQQRYAEASAVLQHLPESLPELRRLTAELSLRRAGSAEDLDRAIQQAEKSVAQDSEDYRDHVWLGQVLWAAGKKTEAEAAFRRAIKVAPKVADPRIALVQYLAGTGDKEKATGTIEEARSRLGTRMSDLALAQCYEAVGDMDRARELYRTARRDHPDDVATLRAGANFFLRTDEQESQLWLESLIIQKAKAPQEAAWAERVKPILIAVKDPQKARQICIEKGLLTEDGKPAIHAGISAADLRTDALVLIAQKDRASRLQAIAALEQLVARHSASAADLFMLAQLYDGVDSKGNWHKTRDVTLRLLTLVGDQPDPIAFHALNLLRHGETDSARSYLNTLERLPGQEKAPRTIEIKARILAVTGDSDEVVKLLQAHAAETVKPPEEKNKRVLFAGLLLDELSQAHAEEDAYATTAEELYRQYTKADPQGVPVLVGYLTRHGRLAEAIALCDRAWEICRADDAARAAGAVLAAAPDNRELLQRTERGLRSALAKGPPSAHLQVFLANVRDLQGHHAEAIALYREVVASNPRNRSALNNLAWLVAMHDRKGAEALELVNRAIDVARPDPLLLDTRATIYLVMGQNDLAVKDLMEVTAQDPKNAMAFFHLAEARRSKERDSAKAALVKARSLKLTAAAIHPLERPDYEKLCAELGQR